MNAKHYYPNKLVEARSLTGQSQSDIAKLFNVDRQTIHRAETGAAISYELLAKLCGYYRIPMTNIVVPSPEDAQVV